MMSVNVLKARSKFTSFTRDYMILAGLALLVGVFALLSPSFVRPTNIINILLQTTTVSIVAIGQATLLMTGQLDLSIGQNVCLSGFISTYMMVYMKLDPWLAILIGILAAVGIGASNGLIVTRIGIPAFITTLATMNICTGLADLVTFTKTIAQLPDAVGVLGRGYVFDFIPVSVLIMFGLYILMAFVFSKTRLGRNMYAIGGNPEAAFFAGINTKKYYMIAFMMSGLFAGISASILLSRLNSAGVGSGYLYEFEALIGCVLGGVAFSGGKGKIIGVLLGVMFSVILFNGMTILNIHSFVQFIFKGVVLVAAMSFDVIRNRKRA